MALMAHFVLTYRYVDADARARTREEHLAYLGGLAEQGQVLAGGPIGDGSGAMVVYRVADRAEAERLVADDPYTREGVSGDRELREWTVAVPSQE